MSVAFFILRERCNLFLSQDPLAPPDLLVSGDFRWVTVNDGGGQEH